MEDRKLSEKESLDIITQMINWLTISKAGKYR